MDPHTEMGQTNDCVGYYWYIDMEVGDRKYSRKQTLVARAQTCFYDYDVDK